MELIRKVLCKCARHGKLILIIGLVAGLALPTLAKFLQQYLPEMVGFLLFVSALRIAPDQMFGTLAQLRSTFTISLVYQIAIPLIFLFSFKIAGLTGPIPLAIILMACAASIAGGANLVLLLGQDPAPALRMLVIGTALLPLTVLPTFLLLPELGSAEVVIYAAAKLLALILVTAGGAFLVRSFLLRHPSPDAVEAIDGVSALAMAIVVIGLMAAVGPALSNDLDTFLLTLFCACIANFGLQTIAWFSFSADQYAGDRVSYTVIAGNRNLALFLASLPFSITEPLLLFIGCYQIPMYLTPIFLRLFVGPRN